MSRTLECPSCKKRLLVPDQPGLKGVVCPACNERIPLRAFDESAVPLAQPTEPGGILHDVPDSKLPSPSRQGPSDLMVGASSDLRYIGDFGRMPQRIFGVRFTFLCQRCRSVLEAISDHCGTSARCPTCGAIFTVPHIDPVTRRAIGPALVADDGQLPTPMHAYATAGEKAPQIKRLENGEQVIVCPRCGRNMAIDADECSDCGLPFTIEGAEKLRAGGGGGEANGPATAALTVGILSLLGFCLPGPGVIAIGLGIWALKRAEALGASRPGANMAIAGIICGAVSTAVSCILLTL